MLLLQNNEMEKTETMSVPKEQILPKLNFILTTGLHQKTDNADNYLQNPAN